MANDKVIITENLTKKFGAFTAVNNITFDVDRGEIFGFLGANGAGKTTAIKMLTGLLSPTSGMAQVAGFDVFTQAELIKKNIGYMSQKFTLYEDLTVVENIAFYAGIYGISDSEIRRKTDMLLDKLDLGHSRDSLIVSIPLGWKQKLAFSISIIHDPEIVFLDEPTGGVDPITRRQFWDMIYEAAHEGRTVFVTTHYMDEAEYCDRVSIMAAGRIEAMDTPHRLKESYNAETMDEVFTKIARPDQVKE
ncbi:MAG: ABC transporter ATP-binding protein [Candidatus Kapaibacterium sp.]